MLHAVGNLERVEANMAPDRTRNSADRCNTLAAVASLGRTLNADRTSVVGLAYAFVPIVAPSSSVVVSVLA